MRLTCAFLGVVALVWIWAITKPFSFHQTEESRSSSKELVIAVQDGARSLDPHQVSDAPSMRYIENIYCTLFRYGDTYGEITPELVSDYQISNGGKTYTFRIKDPALFHSGRPIRASDVIYSLQRLMQESVRKSEFPPVDEFELVSNYEFRIHLQQPFAPLLVALAHPMSAIVDREVVESTGLASHDGGCGPFQLVEWRRDSHLLLKAFPQYFEEGLPHLKQIRFRPIPNETARSTAFRNHEVDLLLDVPLKAIPMLEDMDQVILRKLPGTFWEYVGLNIGQKPFSDPAVREAVALSIDREQLIEIVKFGQARSMHSGLLPGGHWAALPDSPSPMPDAQRARRLILEAGYPQGLDVTLKVGSAFPFQVAAAQVLKQQLRAANIRVQIQPMESGLFFNDLGQRNFQMSLVGWVGFVDPDQWMFNIFHSEGPWNQQSYANPEVDTLLSLARKASDRKVRAPLYRKAQSIVMQEVPMVFLYLNDQVTALWPNVSGYNTSPTASTKSLRQVSLEEEPAQ